MPQHIDYTFRITTNHLLFFRRLISNTAADVDRNAIAQARLNDLEEDLNMTGTQFNTTVSILFVGYVLMQVPSNMMITKVRPGLYMSSWMLIWAAVSGESSGKLELAQSHFVQDALLSSRTMLVWLLADLCLESLRLRSIREQPTFCPSSTPAKVRQLSCESFSSNLLQRSLLALHSCIALKFWPLDSPV